MGIMLLGGFRPRMRSGRRAMGNQMTEGIMVLALEICSQVLLSYLSLLVFGRYL